MELLNEFTRYLLSQKKPASPSTVLNYKADVTKFLHWFEDAYKKPFHPDGVSYQTIDLFKRTMLGSPHNLEANAGEQSSVSSLERYLSSLRKFFQFLQDNASIDFDPMTNPAEKIAKKNQDPWRLHHFKNYLYLNNNANLTIKNYIMDIHQFVDWLTHTTNVNTIYLSKETSIFQSITINAVEQYKDRLFTRRSFSPTSINRKLSAIRSYIKWLEIEGLLIGSFGNGIKNMETNADTISKKQLLNQQSRLLSAIDAMDYEDNTSSLVRVLGEDETDAYASFPPLRLLQKIRHGVSLFLEATVNMPIQHILDDLTYSLWKLNGRHIFTKIIANKKNQGYNVSNYKKEFYAPLSLSTDNFSILKKIIFHLKYSRPKWYKIYHSYAFVHYLHFGVLILAMFGIGYLSFHSLSPNRQQERVVLGAANIPQRNLLFQGTLHDTTNIPITAQKSIRFSLYNDQNASGSALLWQEVQQVTPNNDGSFSVQLGSTVPLSQSLFSGAPLYIGITLEDTPELSPRETLPTTAYAINADTLEGLFPITDQKNQTRNVLLALDSSGNLTIGNNASPRFEATDGSLTLSGQTLIMTTQIGSHSNLVLSPDGIGSIDLQKPLQNSSNNNNLSGASGAVEVDDMFAILATSSAQSAFTINQNDTGPLISASSSGIAKFTVESSGNIVATGNISGITGLSSSGTIKFSDFSQIGGLLYTNNVGDVQQTPKGNDDQCLIGGDQPHFGSCSTGVTTSPFWTSNGNTLSATNTTQDFLLGGDAPTNAKFSLTHMDTSTPLAHFTGSMTLGGALGVGTDAPHFSLSTVGNVSLADSAVASITNNSILDSKDTVTLRLNTGANPATSVNARFVTFYAGVTNGDTGGTGVGRIGLNSGSGGVDYQTSGADFAEEFTVADGANVEPGDLVSVIPVKTGIQETSRSPIKSGMTNRVAPSQGAYDTTLVGVVSDSAGFTGNSKEAPVPGEIRVTVGLLGQIRTKVSTENGPIAVGDYLTSSSVPGIAMRATKSGTVIGKALENLPTAPLPPNPPTILAFIQPGFADPTVQLAQNGDLAFLLDTSKNNNILQNMTNNLTRYDHLVNQLNLFGDIIAKKITADIIQATSITTDKLAVATENITIAGTPLKDYIKESVSTLLPKSTPSSLISPIAQTDQIHTNIISPLATDEISINGKLVINQNRRPELVSGSSPNDVLLDVEGSASISGQLTADNGAFNTASVSGTLNAKTIVSDTINQLQDNLSSISGQVAGMLSNQYQNTTNTITSTTPTPTPFVIANEPVSPALSPLNIAYSILPTPPASSSASTSFDTFGTSGTSLFDFPVTFSQGLLSFGPTSLADTSIAGQLSIGGNFVIANNGINVLGADLELQPLAQGGIRLVGGKIEIDTDGNLKVDGNAYFAKDISVQGVFAAKIISPLPDQDLVMRLGRKNSKGDDVGSLVIQNASNSAVVRVNSLGDLTASGSAVLGGDLTAKNGTFNKLNFPIMEAQALSLNEIIATGSAGTAAIKAHQVSLTVQNALVTKDSLIYISPVGTQSGQTPYLQRQVAQSASNTLSGKDIEGAFTVGVQSPSPKNILFNWLIVN